MPGQMIIDQLRVLLNTGLGSSPEGVRSSSHVIRQRFNELLAAKPNSRISRPRRQECSREWIKIGSNQELALMRAITLLTFGTRRNKASSSLSMVSSRCLLSRCLSSVSVATLTLRHTNPTVERQFIQKTLVEGCTTAHDQSGLLSLRGAAESCRYKRHEVRRPL